MTFAKELLTLVECIALHAYMLHLCAHLSHYQVVTLSGWEQVMCAMCVGSVGDMHFIVLL